MHARPQIIIQYYARSSGRTELSLSFFFSRSFSGRDSNALCEGVLAPHVVYCVVSPSLPQCGPLKPVLSGAAQATTSHGRAWYAAILHEQVLTHIRLYRKCAHAHHTSTYTPKRKTVPQQGQYEIRSKMRTRLHCASPLAYNCVDCVISHAHSQLSQS